MHLKAFNNCKARSAYLNSFTYGSEDWECLKTLAYYDKLITDNSDVPINETKFTYKMQRLFVSPPYSVVKSNGEPGRLDLLGMTQGAYIEETARQLHQYRTVNLGSGRKDREPQVG